MNSVRVFTSEELATAELRQAVIDLCLAAHEEDVFRYMFTKYFSSAPFPRVRRRNTRESHGGSNRAVSSPQGSRSCAPRSSTRSRLSRRGQNQGYGNTTMQRLAETIGDYEIGCLQTDRTSFYAHLGWEGSRGPLAGRSDDGLIPTPDQQGVMVLRLPNTPPCDLDAALTIECQPERIWD